MSKFITGSSANDFAQVQYHAEKREKEADDGAGVGRGQ